MSDLICENYPMVLVMSRFGIALGFGEKNIGEVCRQNGVDPCTFLTVVNFLTEEVSAPMTNIDKCLSIEALITICIMHTPIFWTSGYPISAAN